MPGFIRRFRAFPGFATLGEIESSNIIDVAPPSDIAGAGAGAVMITGEFEDGPFAPTEVFGETDLTDQFGGFGFLRVAGRSQDPVARKSGGDELWNGNAFVYLRSRRFARLMCNRVDNSAGEVELSRLACLTGGAGPFSATTGQDVDFERDGSIPVVATFTGAKGTISGDGFPGDTSQAWQEDNDGGPSFVDMTTEFNDAAAADVIPFPAVAAVEDAFYVGRSSGTFSQIIFDYAGGTAGVDGGSLAAVWEYFNGSAFVALTGVTDGTANFTTAVADGLVTSWTVPTDWVANDVNGTTAFYVRLRLTTADYSTNPILDQAFVEANNVSGFIGGETATFKIDQDANRIVTFSAADQTNVLIAATINAQLAQTVAVVNGTQLDMQSVIAGTAGRVEVVSGSTGTLATLGLLASVANGTGNVPSLASFSVTAAVAVIDAASGLSSETDADGLLRSCNSGTPVTGTLKVTGGTLPGLLGYNTTDIADAAAGSDVTIPAGTVFKDATATATRWVSLTSTATGTLGGPFTLKVRPATDDDTALASSIGNVTIIESAPLPDGFSVTNAAAITRLSASQLDARYLAAYDRSIDPNGISRDVNTTYAARSSENIMTKGKDNALTATAEEHASRKSIVSPPLGTTRVDAKASSGVGVGNVGRDERQFYCYPGFKTLIPEILELGVAGGVGFTADGIVDIRAEGYYAMIRSILNPEENAGQFLGDTNVNRLPVLSLESAFNKEDGGVSLNIGDYKSFKASGIIAPRLSRVSGAIYQSDVTSVDPVAQPSLVPANRRFMGDLIIDTVGDIGLKFVKKLQTDTRRIALVTEIRGFLKGLLSEEQAETSRIREFSVIEKTTPSQRRQGFWVGTIKVVLIPEFLSLVFFTEIGATVVIEQAA